MESIENTIKNKVLTVIQKNYVVKRLNEIRSQKLENLKKDEPTVNNYRNNLRDIPDFRDEAEDLALKGGYYHIVKDPDFEKFEISKYNSTEDLLKCIVIIDKEAVDRINKQLIDKKIKERDDYVSRIKAVKDEATRITDNLLLSDSQDILESLKKFESTEF